MAKQASREYKELFDILKSLSALKKGITEEASESKIEFIYKQMGRKYDEFRKRFEKLPTNVQANSAMRALFRVAANTQTKAGIQYLVSNEPAMILPYMTVDPRTDEMIVDPEAIEKKKPKIEISKKVPVKEMVTPEPEEEKRLASLFTTQIK